MFGKRPHAENDRLGHVDLTPLIDVSLVLVVILLLATPLAFESSFGLRKTREAARSAEQSDKVDRIEITVLSEEDVRVNRTVVPRAQLVKELRPLLEASLTRQVVVTCKDNISHGTFVDVLDQAKVCGAMDIAMTGR